MIIALKSGSTSMQVQEVRDRVAGLGEDPRVVYRFGGAVIGTSGRSVSPDSLDSLRDMTVVADVRTIHKRYKLASREYCPQDSVVHIGGRALGGGHFQIIAGPCVVESREQILAVARDLSQLGIGIIRGGTYKPRTSPYDFQGSGQRGVQWLGQAARRYGVAVVTEIMGTSRILSVARVADALQIGARNCQNYDLLEHVARVGKPVVLKRGMGATIEEWLSAAEYLLVNGCSDVVLCERGIRTFENATRSTLDISAVAIAKRETHLPVIVDPSHAAGCRELVEPLAKAAIAAGADGLLIEAHPDPAMALCDGPQQIPIADIARLVAELRPYIRLAGKHMA